MDYIKEILTFGEIIRDLGLHLEYNFLYDSVHCVRVWVQVPQKTTTFEVTKHFSLFPKEVWERLQGELSGFEYSWSDPDRNIDEFTITLPEFKTTKELKMKLDLMGK